MLQLNYDIQINYNDLRTWSSPNRITVLIRYVVVSLKATAKLLIQRVKRREAVDTEAGVDEEKTAEKALAEYRQELNNTFRGSERINDIMKYFSEWLDGE